MLVTSGYNTNAATIRLDALDVGGISSLVVSRDGSGALAQVSNRFYAQTLLLGAGSGTLTQTTVNGYPNSFYTTGNLNAAGNVISNNWFRSIGATGWYNETYGGGMWMQGTANVEVYGGKNFYVPNAGYTGLGLDPTIFAGTWRAGIQGLGTTAGTYALVVRNGAGSNLMYLVDNGGAWVNSTWSISDRRDKHDIHPLATFSWERFMGLEPVSFIRNISGEREVGFIAQDVELAIPEAATSGGNSVNG